jgi:hypothetical protein
MGLEKGTHLGIAQASQSNRHRPRTHRRQQPAGFHRRQHEQAAGRRLLQELQERIGCLLARLLGDEAVCLSHDEDPPPTFDGRQRGLALEQPYAGQTVGRHTIDCRIQRLASTIVQYLRNTLPSFLYLLVRICCLGPWNRHVPVHIRVR